MGDDDLLTMLAAEAGRRTAVIIEEVEGLAATDEKDPEGVEKLRVEAHGLKGAALVVGQQRLAELARRMEIFLKESVESGRIEPGSAAAVVSAAGAFREGAEAAAEGGTEPPSVGEAMQAFD